MSHGLEGGIWFRVQSIGPRIGVAKGWRLRVVDYADIIPRLCLAVPVRAAAPGVICGMYMPFAQSSHGLVSLSRLWRPIEFKIREANSTMMRSHYCGQLNESLDGQEITLCGWVHRRRDHGGVIFLDVRDREGLAQVVFDPDRAETFAAADRVRSEYVIKVTGKVRLRPAGAVNPNIASGAIEVLGYELEVLNDAETPPFPLNEYSDVGEETRLRYRFIDLRRPEMAEKLKLRSRITASIRRYLDENGFLDVETPILGRPTPEGARDYLVPSRTHAGNFFALPQSPQLFKQLLMVAGFDRYYQIAKCFRDEDLRADRQPEFTQIDIETSFLDEADIIGITEGMIRKLFKEVLDLEFGEFPHMPFEEAMRRYGSDKPDLRIPLSSWWMLPISSVQSSSRCSPVRPMIRKVA